MQSSKTFRLFVSSTFSDFKQEREVLQGEVFKDIKEYCKDRGYTFLPIDLRWGVNEEAQIDQKTLELCLREVQTCKSYPYPNFLLMLGDRYGWVPLPYAIESKEFEKILQKTTMEEKEYLLEWYQKDLNQIPASYILKERYGEFIEYEKWEKEESRLRDILQSAVVQTNISEQERRKYFLSATEAEIEEGIITYIAPTKFQLKLIEENHSLKEIDAKNIFGFFRTVEPNSKKSDFFISSDNQKAKSLKQRVKETLLQENILEVSTAQTYEKSLDTSYLEEFKQRVTNFLKAKVDEQIKKEQKFTPLEIEQQAQEYFAKQKRANFIGQEDGLKRIQEYITNQEQSPLVIFGKSGSGKSALMAKAIQEAKEGRVKVVYRFVGTTPNSNSTKEILVSIFEELGVQLQEQKKQDINKMQSLQDSESFEDFSYRVYNEIIKLKDSIVIFIDAIDQLQNEDEFLWLPSKLPQNIKIVISALDDTNYKNDSKFFAKLKQKTNNLYQMPPFDKPMQMLESLLKTDNRTLQQNQKDYFLQKYQKVNRPLYIFVASKELKHWKSFDSLEDNNAQKTQKLANTQEGVIKEYIENLSTLYHHKKQLVQRVLGYIYASRDGLSENEILELLSMDKKFVKSLENKFHENKSGGLPVVIWARLYTHLSDFLSKRVQENEKLYWFFHREFIDVIAKNPNQKELHKQIIEYTQELITKNQHKSFDKTRWGKLYSLLLSQYILRYQKVYKKAIDFIVELESNEWRENFIVFTFEVGEYYREKLRFDFSKSYFKLLIVILKKLYKHSEWFGNNLAISYERFGIICQNEGKILKALKYYTNFNKIAKKLYKNNPQNSQFKNNLSISYEKIGNIYRTNGDLKKSLKFYKKSLKFIKKLKDKNSHNLTYKHGLAVTYQYIGIIYQKYQDTKKALKYFKKYNRIEKKLYKNNPQNSEFKNNLSISYQYLGNIYKTQGRFKKAIKYYKVSNKLIKELSIENPQTIDFKDNLAISYSKLGDIFQSRGETEKALYYYKEYNRLKKELYKSYPQSIDLKNGLAISYQFLGKFYKDKADFKNSLKNYKKFNCLSKELYKNNPQNINFKNNIAISCSQIGDIYDLLGNTKRAMKYYEKFNQLEKELYKKYPQNIDFKNNLAISCSKLGDIFQRRGEIKRALYYYKKYNRLELELYKSYMQNIDLKNNLSISYQYLGIIYQTMGNNQKALYNYKEYNRLKKELYKKYPQNIDFKNNLAISYQYLGIIYQTMGNNQKALEYYKKFNNIARKLYYIDPQNLEYKKILAISYQYLGIISQNIGNNQKALEYYKKFNNIARKLYYIDPQNLEYKYILATSLEKIGFLLINISNKDEAKEYLKKSKNIFDELYSYSPETSYFKDKYEFLVNFLNNL